MPLVTVTGLPSPPSGRTLAAGTVLAVRYDEPYVDGVNAYATLYKAEIDLTNNRWKPEGSANGTVFQIPAGAEGYPTPPVAWLVEKMVLDDATVLTSYRGPFRIYESSAGAWAYATPAPGALYTYPEPSTSFLALTDTPGSYAGRVGQVPKVASGEGALEFGTVESGGDGATSFLGLSDTPSSYAGAGLKGLRVKEDETGIEFGEGTEVSPEPTTADYYVSTTGSDTNAGTFEAPFRTINKAASVVQAGDLVLIRGGTYNEQVLCTTSGLDGNPITFAGYPGETVIHDGFTGTYNPDATGRDQVFGWEVDADWNVVRDLITTNANYMNLYIRGSNNVVLRVTSHSSRYHGFQISGTGHRVEDCYAYDNRQPNGGWREDEQRYQQSGDGFAFSGTDIVARRCVSRHNADDGFDAWGASGVTIEDSVAYDNGWDGGNGNGFKGSSGANTTTYFYHCISFNNLRRGFTNNGGYPHTFYNCTSYVGSQQSVGFQNYDASVNVLRNNVAYGHGADDFDTLTGPIPDNTYNTWNDSADAGGNTDFPITNPLFKSVTRTSTDFMSLQSSSPCIDAGTPVGLPYSGSAPDLGALRLGETIEDLLGRPLDGAGV